MWQSTTYVKEGLQSCQRRVMVNRRNGRAYRETTACWKLLYLSRGELINRDKPIFIVP